MMTVQTIVSLPSSLNERKEIPSHTPSHHLSHYANMLAHALISTRTVPQYVTTKRVRSRTYPPTAANPDRAEQPSSKLTHLRSVA